jgi:hypothetical protein
MPKNNLEKVEQISKIKKTFYFSPACILSGVFSKRAKIFYYFSRTSGTVSTVQYG